MVTKIFPISLMTLNFAAAIVYAVHGDWLRFGYWLSAMCINFFATFIH